MAAKITAQQVKELREKTGIGMMDAKKALVAADGDMTKAIDELRERGVAKAAKKGDRVAAEGLAAIAEHGNNAAIVEVNSETDFVASNDKFKQLVKDIAKAVAIHEPSNMEEAENAELSEGVSVKNKIIELTAVIGEKLSFRRFTILKKQDADKFGSYLHNGGQIAALTVVKGVDDDTARDVAMHIAAVNPKYLSKNDVPVDVQKHEEEVFTKETEMEGKPANIIPKIVQGRMNKYFSENCLDDQAFVKDPDITVGKMVKNKGGEVESFVRYEVGEGIEKKEENFADEVMGELKNSNN